MFESDDYEDHDGKCDSNDKGCNDLVVRIIKKKIARVFHPDGHSLEINFMAGISIDSHGYDDGPATIGMFYYSLGIVHDSEGGYQFYYTKKDQKYIPGSSEHMGGYLSGEAEKDYPSDAFGIGITVSRGFIYGDGFTTNKFIGKGWAETLGAGPGAVGKFEPIEKNYQGYDVGLGYGGPVSMGTVATETVGIWKRFTLPKFLISGP